MNIVLFHSAGADGSSWRGVLQHAGHNMTGPLFPLPRLAG